MKAAKADKTIFQVNANNLFLRINTIYDAFNLINVQKFIKTEDFIQIENLVNNINKIVKDTYINIKNKMNNNIEEQYGSLNINAETYIPKKRKFNSMNNNINYESNAINNNTPSQNYMSQYY